MSLKSISQNRKKGLSRVLGTEQVRQKPWFLLGIDHVYPVWESEEWLQNHAQHAADRGGNRARTKDEATQGQNGDEMEE